MQIFEEILAQGLILPSLWTGNRVWGTEVKPPSDAGAHKKPGKSRISFIFGVDEQLLQVGAVSQTGLLDSWGFVPLPAINQTHPSPLDTPVKLRV